MKNIFVLLTWLPQNKIKEKTFNAALNNIFKENNFS
jgi:hypothetical protein